MFSILNIWLYLTVISKHRSLISANLNVNAQLLQDKTLTWIVQIKFQFQILNKCFQFRSLTYFVYVFRRDAESRLPHHQHQLRRSAVLRRHRVHHHQQQHQSSFAQVQHWVVKTLSYNWVLIKTSIEFWYSIHELTNLIG